MVGHGLGLVRIRSCCIDFHSVQWHGFVVIVDRPFFIHLNLGLNWKQLRSRLLVIDCWVLSCICGQAGCLGYEWAAPLKLIEPAHCLNWLGNLRLRKSTCTLARNHALNRKPFPNDRRGPLASLLPHNMQIRIFLRHWPPLDNMLASDGSLRSLSPSTAYVADRYAFILLFLLPLDHELIIVRALGTNVAIPCALDSEWFLFGPHVVEPVCVQLIQIFKHFL